MDNGMENILDTYLYESNSLLDQLDEMLVKDEKEGDFSSEDVNEIFRIMHTIKGSSAMMDFHSISAIAHHIEDLFFYIRDKGTESLETVHKRELFELMFRSEDHLRSELEKVEHGSPLSDNLNAFSSEIHDFLTKISGGKKSFPETEIRKVSGRKDVGVKEPVLPQDPDAVCFFHIFLEEGIGMEHLRAYMIVKSLKECGLDFRYYPTDLVSSPCLCQDLIDNGFFLSFEKLETAAKAESLLKSQNHIRSFKRLEPPASDSVSFVSTKPTAIEPSFPAQVHSPAKQNLTSVNLMKLNDLNDIVGELVIAESMVTSSPELKLLPKESFDNFMKAVRQLHKLTHDLQGIAMSLRMVPISGIFQKMNRIVRDMNQKLGKQVRLTTIGDDTEIDKTIVDSIQDPIMHIIRNCMDHGIEKTEEERIRIGKAAQGEILLSASHTGSEVVISVSDDGYGMDPQKILAKAAEKGLLVKSQDQYTNKEALELILLPGFSTSQTVTEYSGRGVGMDVVKKNLESVGGTISISSETGFGTTISMKIPLTLAIVDGITIRVGNSIFTIPISNIRQSFQGSAEQVTEDEYGNEFIEYLGSFYPLIRLHKFFRMDSDAPSQKGGILIWAESGSCSCCLLADSLIGEQQVVVKPLPAYLDRFELKNFGISGCTILGDGTISIILDIASLCTYEKRNGGRF